LQKTSEFPRSALWGAKRSEVFITLYTRGADH